jgi:hypothetical protein
MGPGSLRRWRRVIQPEPVPVLILNALVGTFGSGLFLAGYVVYFTRVVGLSAWQVAGGMSLAGVAGLVTSVPIAAFADRFGYRRCLILLHVLRALAYAAYAFVGGFAGFLVIACLVNLADKSSQSLSQALVGEVLAGRARTRLMARMRAMQNTGMSLGALAAAGVLSLSLSAGFRYLTIANGLSFVFTAIQLGRLRLAPVTAPGAPGPAVPGPEAPGPDVPGSAAPRQSKWRYLPISAMNGVLVMHTTVLFVAIPLWISADRSIPPEVVSAVIAINTVLTAAGQVWWTRFARGVPQAAWAGAAAGAALAGCALVMSVTAMVGPVAAISLTCLAAVLLTIAENLQASAAWEISFALAPADARGSHLAVFGLGQSGRDIGGPSLVTAAVTGLGPPGWGLLAALFALGGLGFRQSALRLVRTRPGPGADGPRPAATPAPAVSPASTE